MVNVSLSMFLLSGNMIGEKPYTSGKKCSACPDGFTSCKDNLCSKKSKPRRRRCFETPSDMEGTCYVLIHHYRKRNTYKDACMQEILCLKKGNQ